MAAIEEFYYTYAKKTGERDYALVQCVNGDGARILVTRNQNNAKHL